MEDIALAFFILAVSQDLPESQEHMDNLALGKTRSFAMNYDQMRGGDYGII